MKVWDGILISFLPKYLNVQRCLPSTKGGTHSWMHELVSHFDFSSTGTGICSLTLITCYNIALAVTGEAFTDRLDEFGQNVLGIGGFTNPYSPTPSSLVALSLLFTY